MTTLGWLLTSSASLGLSLGAALLLIPKELWKRWRRRIVDHLDDALRRGVSRFDRRYREFLLSSLRFIDLKGLTTVGFYTPELDEVFVDVSLAYRAPHHVPESMLAELPVEVTDRHSIGHFLDRAQPADDRKLHQVGDLYRSVAAGVTLLERRANGQAPVTETIILAIT